MQRAATPESRLDLPQHSPGSSVTDTRNPRNIYYINLCKVGGNIQKICQICFMKMRQFWIINVSHLATSTLGFLFELEFFPEGYVQKSWNENIFGNNNFLEFVKQNTQFDNPSLSH